MSWLSAKHTPGIVLGSWERQLLFIPVFSHIFIICLIAQIWGKRNEATFKLSLDDQSLPEDRFSYRKITIQYN